MQKRFYLCFNVTANECHSICYIDLRSLEKRILDHLVLCQCFQVLGLHGLHCEATGLIANVQKFKMSKSKLGNNKKRTAFKTPKLGMQKV